MDSKRNMERPDIKTKHKMKSEKAQLTLFMLLGLVFVVVLVLSGYFVSNYSKKKTTIAKKTAEKIPVEVAPINEYVTSCLDKTAADGLMILGKQAGVIFTSKGGTAVDYNPSDEGKWYIKDSDYYVSYTISPPNQIYSRLSGCSAKSPDYPWKNPYEPWNFPYETSTDYPDTKTFAKDYCFGSNNLPTLAGNISHPIRRQITSYIEKKLKNCLDFSVFKGFDIQEGSVKAYVTFAKEDMPIKIKYPLTITNNNTGTKTKIEYFYAKQPVRLEKIYRYIQTIVKNDINDISYNISNEAGEPNIGIMVIPDDNYPSDDLIIVTDSKSILQGKPYEFQFARKNRAPALHYFKSDCDFSGSCNFNNLETAYLHKVEFRNALGEIDYVDKEIIQDHPILSSAFASDPDEDDVNISYRCNDDPTINCNPDTNCDDFQCSDKVDNKIEIKVIATDGELEDYKIMTVYNVP